MTPKTYWISTSSNDISLAENWSDGLPTIMRDGVIDSSHGATVWPTTGELTVDADIQINGNAQVGACIFNLGLSSSDLRYHRFEANGGTLTGTTIRTLGYIKAGSLSVGSDIVARCSSIPKKTGQGPKYWTFSEIQFIDALCPLIPLDFESIKQTPIPHIIHTNDFAEDCDGELALMMLAYLHSLGYCKLVGVVSDVNTYESLGIVDAILSCYGISDVPIGTPDLADISYYGDENIRDGYKSNQIQSCPKLRYQQLGAGAYEDAISMLRRLLGEATQKITILATGDNILGGLVASGADYNGDGCPSGIDLIKCHVAKYIFGGGYFFKNPSAANMISNAFLSTWYSQLSDVPLEFAGEDMSDNQGRNVNDSNGNVNFYNAGVKLGGNRFPPSHPAHWFWGSRYDASSGDAGSYGYGRSESHDVIRAFYAVFGLGSWFTLSQPGQCTNSNSWEWTEAPGSLSHYVISPEDPTTLSRLVESTMQAAAVGVQIPDWLGAGNAAVFPIVQTSSFGLMTMFSTK